ncbi:hypothetical protein B0H65DRAFT_67527 [Neurospora tetraspora]|uniref:Uncharacterized protein n=1 Tax=Neurospora tetraspora TaxID=94610 RepID=A0AAE0JQT6_9PEZI|nr:hypothetical protein B0H65DRAFT_67527 [Neurospora tetraspora]
MRFKEKGVVVFRGIITQLKALRATLMEEEGASTGCHVSNVRVTFWRHDLDPWYHSSIREDLSSSLAFVQLFFFVYFGGWRKQAALQLYQAGGYRGLDETWMMIPDTFVPFVLGVVCWMR